MGVEVNCRAVAVVSRWGMDIGWDATNDDSLLGYDDRPRPSSLASTCSPTPPPSAHGPRTPRTRCNSSIRKRTPAAKCISPRSFTTANGKRAATGLSVLLRQFNHRTGVPVKFERRELRLTDPKLADSPVLYMHGHEDFVLTQAEVTALREYLKNGGLLMAEACCGRQDFANAFVREMQKVLPGPDIRSRSRRSPRCSRFRTRSQQVGVTPALEAKVGAARRWRPSFSAFSRMGITRSSSARTASSPAGRCRRTPTRSVFDTSGALALARTC